MNLFYNAQNVAAAAEATVAAGKGKVELLTALTKNENQLGSQ